MIIWHPTNGNPEISNSLEISKLAFLLSCARSSYHIFPLHRILRGADGAPVCSCGGRSSCTGIGKHPQGRWSIPLDPAQPRTEAVLAFHVDKWPDRGFGVHLGLSNRVCVDVDPRNGGLASLDVMRSRGLLVGVKPHVVTGSGGFHFYFLAPANVDQRTGWRGPNGVSRCSVSPLPGIDLLAGQHFMVLPFSPHRGGGEHRLASLDPPPALPPGLVDLWNGCRAFDAPASASVPSGYEPHQGGDGGTTPSLEAARAYLATMEPAVSGKDGSRRTGRVARVLSVDFGLSRADARMLLREWNASCVPPWSDAELERKLDYGEAGLGTRGWRNRARRGRETDEEREFDKKLEGVPVTFAARPPVAKEGKVCDANDVGQSKEIPGAEVSLGEILDRDHLEGVQPEDSTRPGPATRCSRYIKRTFEKVTGGEFVTKAFPCRCSSCEACWPKKKQLYIDTMRGALWKWHCTHGREECPGVFIATIPRKQLSRQLARIRRRRGEFYAVEQGGLGAIPGPEFLVLSTVEVAGPRWRQISCEEATLALTEAVENLPFACQGKVWRSSRRWKLINDGEKETGKWKIAGKVGCSMEGVIAILAFHQIEWEWSVGKSRYFPWKGIRFKCGRDKWPELSADLEAGDTLQAGTTFVRHPPAELSAAIPDWEAEFMAR